MTVSLIVKNNELPSSSELTTVSDQDVLLLHWQ